MQSNRNHALNEKFIEMVDFSYGVAVLLPGFAIIW